jgi:hypothetical protein
MSDYFTIGSSHADIGGRNLVSDRGTCSISEQQIMEFLLKSVVSIAENYAINRLIPYS